MRLDFVCNRQQYYFLVIFGRISRMVRIENKSTAIAVILRAQSVILLRPQRWGAEINPWKVRITKGLTFDVCFD
jgi:hypothetical protein